MDFSTLDKQMRGFEQSLDRAILHGIYIVARLDGHGFTRLTKKEWDLEKPFDVRFHKAMTDTLAHLMDCGFRIVYGYTQSDEISLLFHKRDNTFGRKERKLISILAAEASVKFSFCASRQAVFDCRLVPLPSVDDVADYFRWRQEDSHRNSLNAHCYWLLRKEGMQPYDVQGRLLDLSIGDKNELLFSRGTNYNELPLWQRRGVAMYFKTEEREGFDPVRKEKTICTRRTLLLDEHLPIGNDYSKLILKVIQESENSENRSPSDP